MDFRETVLEEKLIPRALLQESEPSRAANAISDVFLVNLVIKHSTGEESRGREESRGPEERVLSPDLQERRRKSRLQPERVPNPEGELPNIISLRERSPQSE